MSKEKPTTKLGGSRKCDGCGKVGRERPAVGQLKPAKWVCSADCAKTFISKGNFGVIGWLKI